MPRPDRFETHAEKTRRAPIACSEPRACRSSRGSGARCGLVGPKAAEGIRSGLVPMGVDPA